MHDYARATKSRVIPNIFFIVIVVIGNLYLMNLFLAILLKRFEEKHEEEEDEEYNLHKSGKIVDKPNFLKRFMTFFVERKFVKKVIEKFKNLFEHKESV